MRIRSLSAIHGGVVVAATQSKNRDEVSLRRACHMPNIKFQEFWCKPPSLVERKQRGFTVSKNDSLEFSQENGCIWKKQCNNIMFATMHLRAHGLRPRFIKCSASQLLHQAHFKMLAISHMHHSSQKKQYPIQLNTRHLRFVKSKSLSYPNNRPKPCLNIHLIPNHPKPHVSAAQAVCPSA